MKRCLLMLMLLLDVVAFAQEKTVRQETKTVRVYLNEETGTVHLLDSIGKELQPPLEMVKVDSMYHEGEYVLLIYGNNALITFGSWFVSYDTKYNGVVYVKPEAYERKR